MQVGDPFTEKILLEACCIGAKGLAFMQRLGANVVSHVTQVGDRP